MNPQHPATEHVLHPLTGEAPALDEQAAQENTAETVIEEPAEAAPLQNSGGSYTTAPAATSGSPLLWGLGAVGLIGTAAVLAKSGKSGSDHTPATPPANGNTPTPPTASPPPTAPKPIITLHPVTADNIINLAESRQTAIRISGEVRHAKNGDTVTLHIGEAHYHAPVTNGQFHTTVDGATLANHQSIRATLHGSETQHPYQVDTQAPDPHITLHPIAGDDTIDHREAQHPITVSGSTRDVADGSEVILVCGCPTCNGTVSKTATVQNGQFAIDFAGNELIADGRHLITATVRTQDPAGNSAQAHTERSYRLADDLQPVRIVWDDIAQDNTINRQEAQAPVTLSGRITGLAEGQTPRVTVQIGDTAPRPAQTDGDRFSLTVEAADLAPHTTLTATATTGNGEIRQTRSYRYDTDIQAPQIHDIVINNGHTVNQQHSLGRITVSGTLSHENDIDPQHSTVTLTAPDGSTRQAAVHGNRWTADIAGSALSGSQDRQQLTVRADIQDTAGNRAHSEQSAAYTVDTVPPAAQLTLDPLTGDKHIDRQEAGQTLTVSGRITGEFQAGDEIVIEAGGQTHRTAADQTGAFRIELDGAQLARADTHQIRATATVRDGAGNTATASDKQDYSVENSAPVTPPPAPAPQPEAMIRLNALDAGVLAKDGFTRLSGKVLLDSVFAQGKNAHRLYGIRVEIGDKTYTAAVNHADQRFHIDIPDADLAASNHQTIQYHFDTAKSLYQLNSQNGGFRVERVDAPVLTARHVQWDEHTPVRDGKLAVAPKSATVAVSGEVAGNAVQVGDEVVLQVGNEAVRARIGDDLRFTANVSREQLAQTGKVSATLQNGAVSLHTDAAVSRETALDGTFVSPHTHVNSTTAYLERPYFVNVLAGWNETLMHTGSAPQNPAQTAVLKYTIPDWEVLDDPNSRYKNFSEADKKAIRDHLQVFAKYGNVRFEEVQAQQGVKEYDIAYLQQSYGAGVNAYGEPGGNVYINKQRKYSWLDMGYAANFDTLLHETLHSFGVRKHPHEGHAREQLDWLEDRRALTVMSYKVRSGAEVHDLRPYDIAFVHYRFGVNPQARAGNDVYRFKPYNQGRSDGDVYIWDGSGVDTFDASDQTQGVNVNLTPGSWIYAGNQASEHFAINGAKRWSAAEYFGRSPHTLIHAPDFEEVYSYDFSQNQAFIGYGTQIERLIGSAHNDTLTGNNADNAIYGGAGNDTVKGGAGNDYLDGGTGADNLAGEAGNDTYVIDHTDDTVTETANNGTDTVHSYIDYTLGDHVENLHLFGDALNGTGNAQSNHIVGNARDNVLAGKGGADTLTGGAGKDVFVFSDLLSVDTVTDFTAGEDKIGLQRGVFTAIDRAETALQHIEYNQSNGQLSYQGQHFATIGTDLAIDGNSFVLIA